MLRKRKRKSGITVRVVRSNPRAHHHLDTFSREFSLQKNRRELLRQATLLDADFLFLTQGVLPRGFVHNDAITFLSWGDLKSKPPSPAEAELFGRLSLLIVVPTGESASCARLCSASSPLSEDYLVWKVDSSLQSMGGIPLSKIVKLFPAIPSRFSRTKGIASHFNRQMKARKGSIPSLTSTWPRKDSSFELASFAPSPLTAFPEMPFPSAKPAPSENGFTPLLNLILFPILLQILFQLWKQAPIPIG
ncbi:hypothetical protein V6N12_076128 [Hibiscus sabdariffa]|uniref:Uncharacterized protein n=1 Tax=Hibiscus sabdariffa TaxID=183260 RepID=A0ABR2AXZ2_9ROSI